MQRAVSDGKINFLSASSIAKFSPDESGGCPRRWWFRYVEGRPEPSTGAHEEGTRVHEQIENYLKRGEKTLGEVALSALQFLPEPGTVETEFEIKNLQINEIPFRGRIDCLNRSGLVILPNGTIEKTHVIEVIDWKTTSNFSYLKTGPGLLASVQMAVYGRWVLQEYPFLDEVVLSHVTMLKKQGRNRVPAKKVSYRANFGELAQRWESLTNTVNQMQDLVTETEPSKVPANYESCSAFGGCPHRSYCPGPLVRKNNEIGDTQMSNLNEKMQKFLAAKAGNSAPTKAAQEVKTEKIDIQTEIQTEILSLEQAERAIQQAPQAEARDAQIERFFGPKPTSTKAAEEVKMKVVDTETVIDEHITVKAPTVEHCENCLVVLTPNNSSRSQKTGKIKHIECPTSFGHAMLSPLAPPDQPKITPQQAADAIPAEIAQNLAPSVQIAAAQMGLVQAPAATQEASTELTEAPKKRGRPKKDTQAESVSKKPLEERLEAVFTEQKTNGEEPHFGFPELTTSQRKAAREAAQTEVNKKEVDVPFSLFVDCEVVGLPFERLESVLNRVWEDLCAEKEVFDLRVAPKDSALAYGGWRGFLSASLVAFFESGELKGNYVLTGVKESEIKQIAVEVLRTRAGLFVRGN